MTYERVREGERVGKKEVSWEGRAKGVRTSVIWKVGCRGKGYTDEKIIYFSPSGAGRRAWKGCFRTPC